MAAAVILASQVYLGFSEQNRSVRDTSRGAVRILTPSQAAYTPHTMLSIQSRAMLKRSNDWEGVFGAGFYPPGYPLTLRLARIGGFPLEYVNFGLFICALAGLWAVCRLLGGEWLALPVVVFYTACGFNYWVLALFTSEALVLPLSLAILLALHRYTRIPRNGSLALLSLACAAIFLARFHALAWIFPIVGAHVLLAKHATHGRRWTHLLVFALLSLLPIGLYMAHNMSETGYLTGMERFSADARAPGLWERETGFFDNIRLMLKTCFIDFASPSHFAERSVNSHRYRPSLVEWLLLIAFAAYVGVVAISFLQSHGRAGAIGKLREKVAMYGTPTMALLVVEFYGAFIIVTIALWTVGNNDPIYTRFMYPSYVFFILLVFLCNRGLVSVRGPVWASWLFRCLCAGIVMVNLAKVNQVLKWF